MLTSQTLTPCVEERRKSRRLPDLSRQSSLNKKHKELTESEQNMKTDRRDRQIRISGFEQHLNWLQQREQTSSPSEHAVFIKSVKTRMDFLRTTKWASDEIIRNFEWFLNHSMIYLIDLTCRGKFLKNSGCGFEQAFGLWLGCLSLICHIFIRASKWLPRVRGPDFSC